MLKNSLLVAAISGLFVIGSVSAVANVHHHVAKVKHHTTITHKAAGYDLKSKPSKDVVKDSNTTDTNAENKPTDTTTSDTNTDNGNSTADSNTTDTNATSDTSIDNGNGTTQD